MTAVVSEETRLRDQICAIGKSLFDRGLTFGSSGNISARLGDGRLLMTPTNASLGALEPEKLSRFSAEGVFEAGDKPTKEAFLHTCVYCQRKQAGAVVHLHSTHAVAVSLLAEVDPQDVLPPLTAYYVMRVGRLPLVTYYPPGDETLAEAVRHEMQQHSAVLLANHGPVVSGATLAEAQYAMEELEETAKLYLLTRPYATRPLTEAQAARLRKS